MTRRLVLIALLFLSLASVVQAENQLVVKYRATRVDVDKPYFEEIDTSRSSFVTGAWYDKANEYLVISLSGTNYHYCGLDEGTWKSFKTSASYGTAYNRMIKGNFDCRIFPVPRY